MKCRNLALFIATFLGNYAWGMQQIPTSALPIKTATPQPTITATIIQPARETQSTATALLFNAISKGDATQVEKLLQESKDSKELANALDSKGQSALIKAVQHPHIVELLINHGADVNFKNTAGIPPLREAVIVGNIDSVKYLIRNHANIDEADGYGITPLMMAVSQGPARVALYLINAGANINAEDKGGQTVWQYSTFSSPKKVNAEEKAEIQKLLEEKGARKESPNKKPLLLKKKIAKK